MPNQDKPQDSYQEDANGQSMDGRDGKLKEANATRRSNYKQEKAKAGPAKTNKYNLEAFHWRRPDFRAIRTGQLHFRALWTKMAASSEPGARATSPSKHRPKTHYSRALGRALPRFRAIGRKSLRFRAVGRRPPPFRAIGRKHPHFLDLGEITARSPNC
jgi:hypothetical protein